jgi:hypothetical protein
LLFLSFSLPKVTYITIRSPVYRNGSWNEGIARELIGVPRGTPNRRLIVSRKIVGPTGRQFDKKKTSTRGKYGVAALRERMKTNGRAEETTMTTVIVRSRAKSIAARTIGLLMSAVAAQAAGMTPQPLSNAVIPPGYAMTAVATGLNFPTAMTLFDDTIWVTEEGTATSPPAVKQIDRNGNVTTMLTATMLQAGTIVSR